MANESPPVTPRAVVIRPDEPETPARSVNRTRRRGQPRCAVAGVLLVVVVVVAACGSGHRAQGSKPRGGLPAGPTSSSPSSAPTVVAAQFTPDEATRAAPLDADDAQAVQILAADPSPTGAERVGMHDGMQHHRSRTTTPSDPGAAAHLAAELRAARLVATQLDTVASAERAGYRLTSRTIPGIGAHYVDWSRVTAPFTAASPGMLLFDGDGPDARLVGLSYLVRSHSEPEGFRAGGAVWHRHAGLCLVRGLLVGENVADRASCADGAGDLLPGRDLWMLHVWVVPGRRNPWGRFAAVNPSLCSRSRPC